jgi:hypothetical protein
MSILQDETIFKFFRLLNNDLCNFKDDFTCKNGIFTYLSIFNFNKTINGRKNIKFIWMDRGHFNLQGKNYFIFLN